MNRRVHWGFILVISASLQPRPALSQPAAKDGLLPGLVATYSDGRHAVKLVAPAPAFYLRPDESAHPSLASVFDAEWTGLLSILQAGAYKFECGDAEVRIDEKKVTDKPVPLTAGRHPITVRYRRKPGVAVLRLEWQAAHFPLEPIPSSAFSHRAAQAVGREHALVERGRNLIEELGCVNCHVTQSRSLRGRLGPDLSGIGSRLDPRWLHKWLEDPAAFRSGAVMPATPDGQQRRDLTSYLVSLKTSEPAQKIRKPAAHNVANGTKLFGLVGCAACHQQEGLALEGMGSKTTLGPLMDFLKNPARLDPGGSMPSLMLTDEEAFALAAFLMESRNREFEQPWTAGDPPRGKTLVQSVGCLACHTLRDGELLRNQQSAPRLERLASSGGCLAAEPGKNVPHYRLTSDDRDALRAFLTGYQQYPDISEAPVYQFYRSAQQLRCVTCHQVDHMSPTATLAEAAPPLTDAGAKLRTGWIEQVMTNRQRAHMWLELRMPDYDPRHVKPMAEAFAKAAGVEPGNGKPAPPAIDQQRTRGAAMIGADAKKGGMACIGCHDWGPYKSSGEEGPQLLNVTQRLRYEWYRRWMMNPARILSGTSMPTYFSSMDPRRAEEAIHTLWAALSLGERMPLPDGLRATDPASDPEAIPVPDREPIVIRWDMPEATPAAIAVGLPGKISYCFDAGESRLRYAWLGGFVDMTGTLLRKVDSNRLTPTAKLIGEIFYRSDEFPLRIGAVDRIPPRRFRGYRLLGGYLQFHYQAGGIDVYERILPTSDKQGVTREFAIARVDEPMWFVTGPASDVLITSSIGEFRDGTVQIPQGKDVRFQVTILKARQQ